jgi:hypothetical protein
LKQVLLKILGLPIKIKEYLAAQQMKSSLIKPVLYGLQEA